MNKKIPRKKLHLILGLMYAIALAGVLLEGFTGNPLYYGLIIAALLVNWVLGLMYDKCPHCGKFLNWPLYRGYNCPYCQKDVRDEPGGYGFNQKYNQK